MKVRQKNKNWVALVKAGQDRPEATIVMVMAQNKAQAIRRVRKFWGRETKVFGSD